MKGILLFVCLLVGVQAFGQEDLSARQGIEGDIPTIATTKPKKKEKGKRKDLDATKVPDYPKKTEYLLTRKPTKVLYGNPCAEEVTYNYGFIYVFNPKNSAEGYYNENAFWHNFTTKFKLLFKNGPFYMSKVKKGIKECRKSSGDFVY